MNSPAIFREAGWIDIALICVVILCLARIAIHDARSFEIDFRWVAALVAAGILWRIAGPGRDIIGGAGWTHAIGGLLGAAIVLIPIAVAEMTAQRWPIYPGDAALLGGIGIVLGVWGLFQTLALGGALAILHRMCVQRKRGRPWRKGYMPLAPGICAGAAVVFIGSHATAADRFSQPPPPSPVIEATELAPIRQVLPPEIAGRPVDLEINVPVSFETVAARIGAAANIRVRVEERPSRSSDETFDHRPPASRTFVWVGSLEGALDQLASDAGYAWEWRKDTVVLYRYWDRQWVREVSGIATADREEQTEQERTDGFLARAWRSLLGGGQPEPPPIPAIEEDTPVATPLPADGEEVAVEQDPPSEAGEAPDQSAALDAEAEEEAPPQQETVEPWIVDPALQPTLQEVLEHWAARAGWTVEWRTRHAFSVGAKASFTGDFLTAVDELLSGPETARTLVARAWSNRYLVITGADE